MKSYNGSKFLCLGAVVRFPCHTWHLTSDLGRQADCLLGLTIDPVMPMNPPREVLIYHPHLTEQKLE